VAVFRLPANQKANIGSPDSNLPILEPIWINDFDGQDLMPAWEASDNVYVRTFKLDDASVHVELAKKDLVLTLRIPTSDVVHVVEIVEKCTPFSASVNIEAHLDDRPLLSFRLSSTHVCTASGPKPNTNTSESRTKDDIEVPACTRLSPSRFMRLLHFLRRRTSKVSHKIGDSIQLDLIPRPLLLSVRPIAELRLEIGTGLGPGLRHKSTYVPNTGVGMLLARSIPWSTLSSAVIPCAPRGACRPRTMSYDAWSGDLLFLWQDDDNQTCITVLGLR
jgi:hypothetical protein